ncbi:MAG TPA: L,D-transpeptidase, partial [Chitinophagaceae bacterium]|nr:L,D-transpeptidase [Chitinophagaceae bacterium]
MKNLTMLTSLFLGSALLASHTHSARKYAMHRQIKGDGKPIGTVSIIIDKSDYELSVYDDKGWYATYPVVFGNNSLA